MRSVAQRHPDNPIITPAMVRPSRPDLRVVGAFNPGVTRQDGETVLLLRVADGPSWLTSISHLRVARSTDGIHFDIETSPALAPATPYEAFGVEDARISRIGETYWINYTAVSSHGIATGLASTYDFKKFERHG